jgi:hypothetical protein
MKKYLKELEFENFLELVNYLDSITEEAASLAIGGFFPGLTAVQELELNHIIETKEKDLFEKFKSDYPDIEIDPEGTSTPVQKNYWEVAEKALNHVYDLAFNSLKKSNFKDSSPAKENTQIYNARTLSCLKNMEYVNSSFYYPNRKLFIEKFPQISLLTLEMAESNLKKKEIDAESFMSYVLTYCKKKKYENFATFIDHLLRRIDVLSSDKDMSSHSNIDFLDSINRVINKNK